LESSPLHPLVSDLCKLSGGYQNIDTALNVYKEQCGVKRSAIAMEDMVGYTVAMEAAAVDVIEGFVTTFSQEQPDEGTFDVRGWYGKDDE
jgi:hypothetical protein